MEANPCRRCCQERSLVPDPGGHRRHPSADPGKPGPGLRRRCHSGRHGLRSVPGCTDRLQGASGVYPDRAAPAAGNLSQGSDPTPDSRPKINGINFNLSHCLSYNTVGEAFRLPRDGDPVSYKSLPNSRLPGCVRRGCCFCGALHSPLVKIGHIIEPVLLR